MPANKQIELYLPVLRSLRAWCLASNVPFLVIGGIAVGLLGRPRATHDVDGMALLDLADLDDFFSHAKTYGFVPRRSGALAFAKRHRILLLEHAPTGVAVDLSLGCLPFEVEAIERARTIRVANVSIPLPTPEDVIVMKATAHRDVDRDDIVALLNVYPHLDHQRILHWVKAFADVLEMPELYTDVAALLKRHRPRAVKPRTTARRARLKEGQRK